MSPELSRKTRKIVLITVASVAAVGIAGGAFAAVSSMQTAEPTATPTAAETSPRMLARMDPVVRPAIVQPAAIAQGTVAGWALADRLTLAAVLPRVGDAAEGSLSVAIDAPVVPEPRTALAATVNVAPETEYTLSAMVRLPQADLTEAPAEIRVGSASTTLPELNADWQVVTTTYTTAPTETALDVSVVVTGAVRGLSVDQVSLVAADGIEVIPNGSFEDTAAERGVRNDSLILQQSTATLAVQLAPGEARWSAAKDDGTEVATGTAVLSDRLSPVALNGVTQGYYKITVTDAAGESITAPVGVIDMPNFYVPTDHRFGTHVHAAKEFAADSTPSAAALGLGIIRLGDNWQVTEPTPGNYVWNEPFAQAMAEATVNGMHEMVVVGRNNKAYDNNKPPISASGLAAYGRYAAALASHYDVEAIEVYNEWNIPSFNKGPCLTGGCYQPVLDVAYDSIKAVKPDLPVVGGVTGNFDRTFFKDLWNAGGMGSLNLVSFHPYQTMGNPEELAGLLGQAREDMAVHGDPKPVWITELGWSSKTGDVSLEQQGEMLIRSEVTALQHGVERYFWYDLVNDKTDRADHEGNFGLFTQRVSGIAAYPPKPAGFAQALLIAKLGNAEYASSDPEAAGIHSTVFANESGEVRIAWSTNGESQIEYESAGPITATSTRGEVSIINPVDGKVMVPVSGSPLILSGGFATVGASLTH